MPLFQYRAVTAASELTEGRMEAPDSRALVDRLHALGHVPLHVDPVASSVFSRLWRLELLPAHRRLRPRALALITGQLGLLLRAGLPLDEALRTLQGLASGDLEKRSIGRLLERVNAGSSLADAMAAQGSIFPDFCISIVRAGEASASLETVLERLTDFIERAEATKEHLKSALVYPAFVAVACCLSIAVLLLIVVPQLRPLFEESGQQLPWSARYLLALSELLQNYWWAGIAGLALMIGLGLSYGRRPVVRSWWDNHLLRMPLVGDPARKIEAARFCRILGTLLKNGVPLLGALSITNATSRNAAFRDGIGSIIENVTVGRGLAESLKQTQDFPQLAEQLVRIGEETACQEEMLGRIADLLEVDTRRRIDRLLTLITPAVTVVLGLIIAGVTMSIMSALLSVYNLAS